VSPDARARRGAGEPGAVDDDALAQAAHDGDRAALEQLLHRHADRIHGVCRRIVGHPEDALDATQEAMIAVARGIHRFDGQSKVSTWIYRVATNAALDEVRRQRRRPVPAAPPPEHGPQLGSTAPDITSSVDARLDVDAALATLPEDYRVAVVLRDLCDLDYAEIATILDIPPGTVRSRIARGRAALEAWFREPSPDPERLTETT
jgi:RNA polymerase sigma-70 factor (ECF subfamily)